MNSTNNHDNFLGLRVYPGPFWPNAKSICLGTIIEVEGDLAYVYWDNNGRNSYAIGRDNCYHLLIWDSGPIGIKHSDFQCNGCSQSITGTKWGCFECSHYLCGKCYIVKCHRDHHFYRVDKENGIGSYVGLRNESNESQCEGIFRNSHVDARNTIFGQTSGIVDSFRDKSGTYRSVVNVKIVPTNQLKTYKLGYRGVAEIKLKEDKLLKIKSIYPSHLKVVGMHPIFNLEFCNIYEKELKEAGFENITENLTFGINDWVFVDCFDNESLKGYQNGFGESNVQIQKLIGKWGSVQYLRNGGVIVQFPKIENHFNFNSKILFNEKNSRMKAIRVVNEIKLTECIDNWKKTVITEKKKDIFWVPDKDIIEKISNKIGVIIIPKLPGGLVGVRFKRFPDYVCMVLPETACSEIDKNQRDPEVSVSLHLSELEPESYNKGLQYISDYNFKGLSDWIFSEENQPNQLSIWNYLVKHTIHCNNIYMLKSLMTLSINSKAECLNRIVTSKYTEMCVTLSGNEGPSSNSIQWNTIMEFIIPALEFNDKLQLLHKASEVGDESTVGFLIKNDHCLINTAHKLNGYSALHYAVENERLGIIRLLMEHKCDIYIQEDKNQFTPLHIALKYYYIKSFCCILELLSEDINHTKVDKNHDTILHLSASLPNEDQLRKWPKFIKCHKITIIDDLMAKCNSFELKYKSKKPFIFNEMPFAVLSYLILSKGQNSFHTWISKINKNRQIPEDIFKKSIKSVNKNISINEMNNSFKLFFRYGNKSFDDQFCEFCKLNIASIVYKPCGHKIHCEYCSFMTYTCKKCDGDIEEKCGDNVKRFVTFEDWTKLASEVKNTTYPGDMIDWFVFIKNTIKDLECSICTSNNWDTVLDCGHTFCRKCALDLPVCANCKSPIERTIPLKNSSNQI